MLERINLEMREAALEGLLLTRAEKGINKINCKSCTCKICVTYKVSISAMYFSEAMCGDIIMIWFCKNLCGGDFMSVKGLLIADEAHMGQDWASGNLLGLCSEIWR